MQPGICIKMLNAIFEYPAGNPAFLNQDADIPVCVAQTATREFPFERFKNLLCSRVGFRSSEEE
jgi:hypothetical protein